jgi:glycosyltransferase involved in cell wall biosynthesis
MPKISVIMPAYNHEEFIAKSIESIINQSFIDWELIVVNDGSTDGTLQVINIYIQEFPDKIRVINKIKNEGTVAGLNDGIRAAAGEYIAWLSSDDLFFNDTIERQIDFLMNHPNLDVVAGGTEYIDEHGISLSTDIEGWVQGNMYYNLLFRCCVCFCSVLARRECYEKVGLFDASYRYAHDYEMLLRLAANFNIGYIPQTIVQNRIHSRQITMWGRNEIDAINVIMNFLENEQLSYNLLNKAGLMHGWKGWLEICQKIYYLYNLRIKELETLARGMDMLAVVEKVPQELKAEFDLLQKKISHIVNNTQITNSEFFAADKPAKLIDLLCNKYSLHGFIINKQALRFERYETQDVQTILRGIPHDNTLVIVEVPGDFDCSNLQDSTYQLIRKWNTEGMNKIGVSSHMIVNPQFSELLKFSLTFVDKQISDIVYEEFLSKFF